MNIKSALPMPRALALLLAVSVFGCADNAQRLQGQDGIKKELAVERPTAPLPPQVKPFQPADLDVAGSPFLGKADAPVTLVEFSDFRCPYCKRHATTTLPQLVKAYVDTGKLKYVVKEFPLRSLHPDADTLALAALCAGDQGKYWDMHDLIFASSTKLDPQNLSKEITALKLNKKTFQACVDGHKYAKQIDASLALGSAHGVSGTPSFLLGKTDSGDSNKVHASIQIKGAQTFENFKTAIDPLLK